MEITSRLRGLKVVLVVLYDVFSNSVEGFTIPVSVAIKPQADRWA
jgi:hypothetical protein